MDKRFVTLRLDLGQTRVAGWVLFNAASEHYEFEEVTPKETLRLVRAGMVNGLKIVDGELLPDAEGFEQRNIKIKSGVGNYRNMVETGKQGDKTYSVIRKVSHDDEDEYAIITSKCGRFEIDEEGLRMLMRFSDVAGVRLSETGEILTCQGVDVVDMRTHADPKSYDPKEILDVGGVLTPASDLTMAEIFGTGGIEEKSEGLQGATDPEEPENAEPVSTEDVDPEKTEPVGAEGVEQPVKDNESSEPTKVDEPTPTTKKPASKGAAAKKKR